MQNAPEHHEGPVGAERGEPAPDGEETVVLYRPTGPEELELVRDSGFRRWPPRQPGQPIFYPVTNARYAAEISSRWNVRDFGSGYVTRFRVRKSFMDRYAIQQVGSLHHTEWWVPADELEALNEQIVGPIDVISEHGRTPDSADSHEPQGDAARADLARSSPRPRE